MLESATFDGRACFGKVHIPEVYQYSAGREA
jgi:hypothetical protein